MIKHILLASLITLMTVTSAHAQQLQIQKENDQFFNQLDQIVQGVNPQRNNSWRVSKLSLNTSQSHDGLLGLLPFSGTATATLTWIPKGPTSDSVNTDIKLFSLADSADNAEATATIWYREFLKAKKLPWSLDNEKNFLKLFFKARSVAEEVATVYHPEWYIDQFVVERGIAISGAVAPLVTAKAQFALRFSFDLQSAKATSSDNTELKDFVLSLAEDLSTSAKQFSLPSWKVKGFNLGLGLSANLGVGVVSAKPFAFAHMMFKSRKTAELMTANLKRKIKRASATGIKFFDFSDEQSISTMDKSEKLIIINREGFRKGLVASLKLAKGMTAKADKEDSTNKKWRLSEVIYRYDMGAAGNLSFVGLKGKITTEVLLQKDLSPAKNFNISDSVSKAAPNPELKKALATELRENYDVLSATPESKTVSAVESTALLQVRWGIDTVVAGFEVSVIPRIRLKFSP